ncbi:MAG: flagellar hook-basal body protein [Actinomycetota bacterium]
MIRGLYIAATGMLAQNRRQDVIANNLANVTTTGFKRDSTATTPFADMLVSNLGVPGTPQVGTLSLGAQVSGITTVTSAGAVSSTGNQLDVALLGSGWISVDAQGGRRYTRGGHLEADAKGTLLAGGSPVEGVNGKPIVIDPNSGPVTIAPDGTVTQEGQTKGRLRIASLDPATVKKEGESLVAGTETGTPTAVVKQGHLEASNVNTVTEMVELIEVMRAFEANQKAALAHSETLQDAVTKVGAVR